jgi:uncharacterized protein (TIGR00290 family)
MGDTRRGKPPIGQGGHPLPRYHSFLAAPTQCAPPYVGNVVAKVRERPCVGWNTVIGVEAHHDPTQPRALLVDCLMHSSADGGAKGIRGMDSGKDSAFALHEARHAGLDIAGILTTMNEVYDRVAMHGVRHSLLNRQIAALDLPAIKVPIPSQCPNEIYEARMEEACAAIRAQGIRHLVFGDLFLEDIRAYHVEKLSAAGMEPVFPLWKRNTAALARAMIECGLKAHITCLDPRRLPRSFAARAFDLALLHELPEGVDPCGENGEFHTVVTAGPMFSAPIPVQIGETVEREGFVFTDVILA